MNRTLHTLHTLKNIGITAACIAALGGLMGARHAMAQEQFKVATGDQTVDPKNGNRPVSTYAAMFRDLNRVCQNVLPMSEVGSTGSPQNLAFLQAKDVDAAIVQGDLLNYMDQTDPASVSNVKTIFTLAPEELHFIARADVKQEGGVSIGKFSMGGSKIEFKTIADLAGRKVGAVGGSITSGRVVAYQSGLKFQMLDGGDNTKLKAGLLDGTYDAILVVGGSPHGLVSSLDQRFRLLPVSKEVVEKMKAYAPATISYSNLNQAGIPTLATRALFVSRVFRDPEILQRLANLRKCVASNVYKLQDAKGTHPKWQQVDPAEKGRWAYYEELPAAK